MSPNAQQPGRQQGEAVSWFRRDLEVAVVGAIVGLLGLVVWDLVKTHREAGVSHAAEVARDRSLTQALIIQVQMNRCLLVKNRAYLLAQQGQGERARLAALEPLDLLADDAATIVFNNMPVTIAADSVMFSRTLSIIQQTRQVNNAIRRREDSRLARVSRAELNYMDRALIAEIEYLLQSIERPDLYGADEVRFSCTSELADTAR